MGILTGLTFPYSGQESATRPGFRYSGQDSATQARMMLLGLVIRLITSKPIVWATIMVLWSESRYSVRIPLVGYESRYFGSESRYFGPESRYFGPNPATSGILTEYRHFGPKYHNCCPNNGF